MDIKIIINRKRGTKFAFTSVVTTKNIEPNQVLTKNNIWVRRPSTGDFNAKDYFKLIGKEKENS